MSRCPRAIRRAKFVPTDRAQILLQALQQNLSSASTHLHLQLLSLLYFITQQKETRIFWKLNIPESVIQRKKLFLSLSHVNNVCSLLTSCKTRPVFSCDFQFWSSASGCWSPRERRLLEELTASAREEAPKTRGKQQAFRGQTEARQELTNIFLNQQHLVPKDSGHNFNF